jgi:hypothetical protein
LETTKPDTNLKGHPPPVIEPVLSLELRLWWLEAILLGVKQDTRDRKGKEKELKHGDTIIDEGCRRYSKEAGHYYCCGGQ